MKLISAIFGTRESYKLCRPVKDERHETPHEDDGGPRQSYKIVDGMPIVPVHDEDLTVPVPSPEIPRSKPRYSIVPEKKPTVSISSDSTAKLSDASNFEDELPVKRKEEVSAEVPKLGVSAEPHNARQIKTQIFEKNKASQQLIRNAIMKNEFLKNLDKSQIDAVVEAMYSKEIEAEQNIITEGETGSHLYVSAEGSFVVYVGCSKINTFGPGVAFGELAILYNTKRNATIQVLTHSRVWVLNRQVFQQIMMRTRLQDIEDKVRFLRSVPLLKDLSSHILAKMSDLLQVEFFAPGHRIIKQGDKGDRFYIISGGSVKIAKLELETGAEKELGVYSHGQYFGELALLKEDTRQATVTAMAPGVECLVLDRVPFIQLLGNLDEIKRNAEILTGTIKEDDPWNHVEQKSNKTEYGHVELNELTYVGTLGVGGFGRVELVQYKKNKKLTFALKYCPFISKLYRTYRDSKYVYFLMEACLGGDVFTALQHYRIFTEDTARFMTACVVEALHYLHDRGFIYRDLKPENLLLDEKGYVKMLNSLVPRQ
ncbi:hypothetical protein L9F63_012525, partial [Diploptera punctata]